MDGSQGKTSGIDEDLHLIMSACSCSRRQAVSALKLNKGDRDAAIRSLKDAESISRSSFFTSNSLLPAAKQSLDLTENPAITRSITPQSFTPRSMTPQSSTSELSSTPHLPQLPRAKSPGYVNFQLPGLVSASNIKAPTAVTPPNGAKHLIGRLAEEISPPSSLESFPDPPEVLPSLVTDEAKTGAIPSVPLPPPVSFSTNWDFSLPTINMLLDEGPFSPDEGRRTSFSLRRLISGLQNGLENANLRHYLGFFDGNMIRSEFSASLCGIPSIFYAVATNNESIVRTWVEYGGDVNARESGTGIPLIAFTILRTSCSNEDTTRVLMTLLSLGTDISVLPKALYFPCIDDPVDKLSTELRNIHLYEARTEWCLEWVALKLATSINLTQRYFLEKTSLDKAPTRRQQQVTRIHDATALLGVKHFLVGQSSATRIVSDTLVKRMALPIPQPLVMAFTGPSGHGKTELAKQMGNLLNLEIECVDCTEMKHETDLFGPKWPYLGYENGSPLNNFLFRMNKKRCIVFLDEIEKTTKEVRNALLVPFDEGRYVDRRTRNEIDCSQTIWIIATNAADSTILDFCEVHKFELFNLNDPIRQSALTIDLTTKIKNQLKSAFGNPLTGRLSVIIPFLPFSPVEAAVVAHKFLLEFKRRVMESIQLSGKRLVGNIVLELERDGAICKHIAEEGYDPDQGARSLKTAIDSGIGNALVQAYLDEEDQIHDSLPITKYRVSLTNNGVLKVGKVTDKSEKDDLGGAGDDGFYLLNVLSMINAI